MSTPTPIARKDIKLGDIVRATKGTTSVQSTVSDMSPSRAYLPELSIGEAPDRTTLAGYERRGFTFELIKAAPKPLPTEPGFYIQERDVANPAAASGIRLLREAGRWYYTNVTHGAWVADGLASVARAHAISPFVRLEVAK
ncbi:hypothetical protein [Microbacterium sp. B24]|uniref:hypothetical protein n=1 Tax=Microbacterium sp. B24 TaxID=95616 RepID=UPI000409A904|nr:hypothetical protein [Microbacterium sp. B24]